MSDKVVLWERAHVIFMAVSIFALFMEAFKSLMGEVSSILVVVVVVFVKHCVKSF